MITSKAYSIHISVHLIHTQNYLDLTIVYVLNQTLYLLSFIPCSQESKRKKKKRIQNPNLKKSFPSPLRFNLDLPIDKGYALTNLFQTLNFTQFPPFVWFPRKARKVRNQVLNCTFLPKKKKSFEIYVS